MSDWKKKLAEVIAFEPETVQADTRTPQEKIENFINTKVKPAFDELKLELEQNKKTVGFHEQKNSYEIQISSDNENEFRYTITVENHIRLIPKASYNYKNQQSEPTPFGEGFTLNDINDVSSTDIRDDFIKKYEQAKLTPLI